MPPDDNSISPNVLKVIKALSMAGWFGFWAQLVLAIISTLILLFAFISRTAGGGEPNPGTGAGSFLAFLGLVAVYISIFWNYRYTLLARELRRSDDRPSRANTIRLLKVGIIISFIGMFVTILGAGAIVGVLVAKSLSQPQSAFVNNPESFSRLVQPLDIFVVQANTNTILAHFLGLVSSVWLLDRISK